MNIANKYNIPAETVKRMVQDGVLPCQTYRDDEIYNLYKSLRNTGKSKEDIYLEISNNVRLGESRVKQIVLKMDKI